jgi:hypothetical protein
MTRIIEYPDYHRTHADELRLTIHLIIKNWSASNDKIQTGNDDGYDPLWQGLNCLHDHHGRKA